MCNKLHPESTPIPQTGFGYKIFASFDDGLFSLIKLNSYQKSMNGRIEFDSHQFDGEGFCFMLDKTKAESIFNVWKQNRHYSNLYVLKKIEYFCGLGKHYEKSFVSGLAIETSLCRSFIIHGAKS